jgi:hypothetical protein
VQAGTNKYKKPAEFSQAERRGFDSRHPLKLTPEKFRGYEFFNGNHPLTFQKLCSTWELFGTLQVIQNTSSNF